MTSNLSNTMLSALEHMAQNGGRAWAQTYGTSRGVEGLPPGATRATLRALAKRGLITCVRSTVGYTSVPAGPFGRTARYGWKSILVAESRFEVTAAGLNAIGAA